MNIILNGKPVVIKQTLLAAVLQELGFTDAAVATALNGDFVSASQRSETELCDGDKLEVLAPMQGG